MKSEPIVFTGQNIKGTPQMSAAKVRQDLKVIKHPGQVFAFQEFKWPTYWAALATVMPNKTFAWRPSGYLGPRSSQPVLWRRHGFKKKNVKVVKLHEGHGTVTQARYIRGVLLQHKESGYAAWFCSTHWVVGGSRVNSPRVNKLLYAQDKQKTTAFLTELAETGHPVLLHADLNSQGLALPLKIAGRPVRYWGEKDVIYTITIDGEKTKIVNGDLKYIPLSELNTDHRGRELTFRLSQETS